MDNSTKLTKGQKKKLRLKRQAEERSLAQDSDKKVIRPKKKKSKGDHSSINLKRPAPDEGSDPSDREASLRAILEKQTGKRAKFQSKSEESLMMQRRSKSYAFGSGGKTVGQAPAEPVERAPKHHGGNGSGGGGSSSAALSSVGRGKLTVLQERMKAKLEGAKFRLINEELYTTRGEEAYER